MRCGDREMWLAAARKVFDGMGNDSSSGRISSEHLIGLLRTKLPAEEVESAVEAAMIDAGYAGTTKPPFAAGCHPSARDIVHHACVRLLHCELHPEAGSPHVLSCLQMQTTWDLSKPS